MIVGAGPCGLACARTVLDVAASDTVVTVLEAAGGPGGLAASVVDAQGFTWDRGGHVVFSHYGEFDRLLADVMGEDVERHERSSYIRLGDAWVPYPFQHNLHHLPADVAADALTGLVEAQTAHATTDGPAPSDFGSWMVATFGTGIVEHFMRPYNEKVWAHPVAEMSASWVAERVATVDWQRSLRATVARQDDHGWGPNNLFSFPSTGGTGEIYRRAAAPIAEHVRYDASVTAVDPARRTVTTDDGSTLEYDALVWTGALDLLVGLVADAPAAVRAAAGELVHNSVTVVGIGYEAPLTDTRSWLYFPEADVPFYRATNFAKYAAANVPGGRTDRYCSWMTEVASSPWRPLADPDGLADRVDTALRRLGLVAPDAAVASVHVDHVAYAYPVPTLGRDAALATVHGWLEPMGVHARGRFGAWRYELGNMDHAVKMGVDVARRIVAGTPEEAWS